MATEKATARTMPKGGRKGGATFPRIALEEALRYSRKLVSKTHSGPQPSDIIFSGVVGAKGGLGDVRISALRQYSLLSGDKQAGFLASPLAKKIASAPEEDLQNLYRQAVLSPKVFKAIFSAFHGDTVSRGKLRQRAGDLNVHPDGLEACVDTYIRSLTTAGLVNATGDQITHLAAVETVDESETSVTAEEVAGDDITSTDSAGATLPDAETNMADDSSESSARPVRSNVNVNITLDSSMDIEKLAKQLELLKKYGAI